MKSKIDYKEITKLADLMKEKGIDYFELEVEGMAIRIGRGSGTTKVPEYVPNQAEAVVSASVPGGTQEEAGEQESANGLVYVTSPMVGTFYRASDPSSNPFVELGDAVAKNQTLCIIEAMKLMNEIEAETDGVIKEIFIKNGKPVEYGQKLFSIKPK